MGLSPRPIDRDRTLRKGSVYCAIAVRVSRFVEALVSAPWFQRTRHV